MSARHSSRRVAKVMGRSVWSEFIFRTVFHVFHPVGL